MREFKLEDYVIYCQCLFGFILGVAGVFASVGHGEFLMALVMGAIAVASFYGMKWALNNPSKP